MVLISTEEVRSSHPVPGGMACLWIIQHPRSELWVWWVMLCIPIRPAFLRMGERIWQSKWKWVHCSGRRTCGWKCLETTAASCHDFASLSPDGCSQGPQLKDDPVLLTTLYLLDAVVAHHSCVGEIGLFSTLILVLSSIFLSKCTGGILWWIAACWAESQSLNLAAVKDGHLQRSEKTGVELLSLL